GGGRAGKAACSSGAPRGARGTGRQTQPAFAAVKPATPARSAASPTQPSKIATGLSRRRAVILGREPSRANRASGTPSRTPTHQVAITPQPKASAVGSGVRKTGGWPTVKYSTRTRAGAWACTLPYRAAAP